MSTTEANTTTTSEQPAGSEKATKDSGANFRASQPKQAGETAKGEKSTNPTTKEAETGDAEKSDSRFGVAGKAGSKTVSFRISTNIKLSFKPYGGLAKKDEYCIKPGGVDGAIKPFTSSSGRKQFKKVGIRVSYSIPQLLSIRDKFKAIPIEIDQIPDVFEEGLGDFEALTNQTITISEKTTSSKLKKSIKSTPSKASPSTADNQKVYENNASQRYEGPNDNASFRDKPRVEPSKIKGSKLRKSSSTSPNKNDDKTSTKDNKDEINTNSKPTPKASSNDNKPKPTINTGTKDGGTSNRSSQEGSIKSSPSQESNAAPRKPLSSGTSRGAWGRSRKTLDPMALLTKKITGKLNKITLDNFSRLSDQLMRIFEDEISNTEQLTKLVTLIFEKTVQEHVYGPLYAKLCVALAAKNKSFDEIVFLNGQKQINQVDFKNVLVKVCQTEFQKGKREAIITDDMDETDKENEMIKQKKILLGTMKFIGQLYLKELIPSKIMTVCLKHLIAQTSKPSEDDVEGACTLIQTVGQTLDQDENVNKTELTGYYSKLRKIEKNSNKYSVRIRMIIQNLIDLRRSNWKSRQLKSEGPRALNRNKDVTSNNIASIPDDFNDFGGVLPYDLNRIMMTGGANDAEVVTGSVVPIQGHVVASKKVKYGRANRYTTNTQYEAPKDIQQEQKQSQNQQNKSILPQRKGRSGGRRQLLQTTEEEEIKMAPSMNEPIFEERKEETINEGGKVEPGRRKSRVSLSASSERPCSSGKSVDEEVIEELTGDYLYVRNGVNEQKFLSTLITYKINDRKQFILKFIQKAIDGGKGERLAMLIPKLLNEYIILSDELDSGFIEFFNGYTFEDNPQLAQATAQLLAPLIADNEINFTDVLEWVLMDTRANQPEDMLSFYGDGDGVREYIKKSTSITKVLELLGELFKELKECVFEDSQYVKKLLKNYNFSVDRYVNQKDLGRKDEIQTEWISKYGLKFAF